MKLRLNATHHVVKRIKQIKTQSLSTEMNFGLSVSRGLILALLILTMSFSLLFPLGPAYAAKPQVSKVLKDLKPGQGDSTFIGTLHTTLKAAGADWSIPRLTGTFGHAFSFSMKIDDGAVWQQANIDWWLLWEMITDVGYEFQEFQVVLHGKQPTPTPKELQSIRIKVICFLDWKKYQLYYNQHKQKEIAMAQSSLPVGNIVQPIAHVDLPRKTDYIGKFIRLSPVDLQVDVAELYECSHGSNIKEQIWTYMSYGPFDNTDSMRGWLAEGAELSDPLFFTVHHHESKQRVGMVSFLNIVSDMRRLELGHIWYSPESQRSNVNTEAMYLMLCEAFDRLKYRRVEWKCDSLNERSRAAALRLGFKFEGTFRQHMIIKGRNRDTAWYSMLDSEWTAIKQNMETWLYQNPDRQLSLTVLNQDKI